MIRFQEGLTQRAMAEEMGTNVAVLRSWLDGRSIARAEGVARLKAYIAQREDAERFAPFPADLLQFEIQTGRSARSGPRQTTRFLCLASDQKTRQDWRIGTVKLVAVRRQIIFCEEWHAQPTDKGPVGFAPHWPCC